MRRQYLAALPAPAHLGPFGRDAAAYKSKPLSAFQSVPRPLERGKRGSREGSRERWRTLLDGDGPGRGAGWADTWAAPELSAPPLGFSLGILSPFPVLGKEGVQSRFLRKRSLFFTLINTNRRF
ncbi:uncharacterized protein LOC108288420 [Cebus imitator]|uniref:uncharacterized protein LOC108288420 n=1 Tax=Cebus imitator TaxID=2715852 RepID=UPI00080A2BC2|nr:uncharacterized protein LOC108288420 [Cebus imitator]